MLVLQIGHFNALLRALSKSVTERFIFLCFVIRKSPWVEPLEPKFDKDQIKLLLNENQIHATEEFWLDRTCKSSKLARLRQIFELMPWYLRSWISPDTIRLIASRCKSFSAIKVKVNTLLDFQTFYIQSIDQIMDLISSRSKYYRDGFRERLQY